EKKPVAAELGRVRPRFVTEGSAIPEVVVNHNAVAVLSRADKRVVIHDADHSVSYDHPVQIIELAVIHSKPASVDVASGELENATELVIGSATILKFNSGDAGKVICNQSDLYQRRSINGIHDDGATNACAL